jgi:flagellar motor switch/type III secretory pathway protein FliN
VSESLLDPQEMEALQAAMRESAPRRSASTPDVEPTRLALIADDRIADAARPVLINVATRWVRSATKALRSHLPGSWQLDVVGAEIIDGATAKEELRGGWVAAATGGDAEIVLGAHGGVIDIAAARRCGAAPPRADSARPPSAVSLRLFEPTGKAMLESWNQAWREVFDRALAPSSDLTIVARLIDARYVVRVAMTFAGAIAGRVSVYARPETLVTRPAALAAIKANAALVANALANVPVEIVVELGTLRLPLQALRKLDPNATFTLPGFVDSRVPVFCEGALKAWAKPVVCRGVLAVQIVSIVHGQGTKS